MDLHIRSPRFLVLSVVALGAMICFSPRRASADDIVTVGATTYDITTITGTPATVFPTLVNQPWYTDPTGDLAKAFAAAVGSGLGTPNYNVPVNIGPLFGYNESYPDTPTYLGIYTYYPGIGIAGAVIDLASTTSRTWAIVSTPEPGTLTLLFAGLLALGLLAGVKRYRGSGLPTQV